MKYLGGKNKIKRYIYPIIQNMYDEGNYKCYIEPFCGSIAIAESVISKNKILSDSHTQLIAMWKALYSGWIPPTEVNEADYYGMKLYPQDYPDYLLGFIGFNCAFAGKYFGTFARDNGKFRNYCREGHNTVLRAINFVKENTENLAFFNCDYTRYEKSKYNNCFFYLDPPYYGVSGYKEQKFNYNYFVNEFLPKVYNKNNTILISEYKQNINLFPNSKILWEKEVLLSLKNGKDLKSPVYKTEILLEYKP